MAVGSTTVQVVYAIASLTSLPLWYIIWRHRARTGARELLVAIAAGWWWGTALFLAATVTDGTLTVLLAKSAYLGVVVAVAAIFLFALAYTGREHLVNRRVVGLLAVEPAVVLVLVFWNPSNVFFETIEATPAEPMGIDLALGPAFYLHALYSYVLVLAVGALILGMVYRTRARYRGQLVVLFAAVFLPLLANAVAVAGYVDFDSTPVGFVVANALYTVAIVRYRLIDLVPIARDRVVDNITDAVYVVDTDDRIVDANPRGESLAETYVGESGLIGSDARDLLEAIPELREIYVEVVAGDVERQLEYAIGDRHFLTEAAPIDDARGEIVGWLFVLREITERKRRERELRERNEQLDKFASVVSHDLRNPLQVAAGRVELARETDDPTHLDHVESALERMEAIIDDVLSLARDGTEVTETAPVDVASVAADAWENGDTTGTALSIETEARIVADSGRLERLFENLFRNAVLHGVDEPTPDARPDGAGPANEGLLVQEGDSGLSTLAERDPDVTVEVGVEDGPDGPVLYVADDGPGIPADERERIFESGYSTADDGTGFGLTIVSQIAEAHGWAVRPTESASGGARFELSGIERVEG